MTNKGGTGTVAYFCHDCKLKFTVYRKFKTPVHCPECGDHIHVRRNPHRANVNPETAGARPAWDVLSKAKLISLYNDTHLNYREIGERLEPQRTKAAVQKKVDELRRAGELS